MPTRKRRDKGSSLAAIRWVATDGGRPPGSCPNWRRGRAPCHRASAKTPESTARQNTQWTVALYPAGLNPDTLGPDTSGAPLASVTETPSTGITYDGNFNDVFTFASPVAVTVGQKYAFLLTFYDPDGAQDDYYAYAWDNDSGTDLYTSGALTVLSKLTEPPSTGANPPGQTGLGYYWQYKGYYTLERDRNDDLQFAVLGVVPEPATMTLIGLGLLGLLRRRR